MRYIKINPNDNVAVALTDLQAGEAAEGVVLGGDVPRGHKVLLKDLRAGENVVKYGFPIGHVTRDAAAGEMIDHNSIKTNLEGLLEYEYRPEIAGQADNDGDCHARPDRTSFMGYRRADGQVGIRNQIWIIPTVGCVNGICQKLAERFRAEQSDIEVIAFPHNYGCSQLGVDHENTRIILADMVHHPNAGGVLVVSLGCENNQLDAFRDLVGPVDESRVKMFVTQKVDDELEYGLQCLREIYDVCRNDRRGDSRRRTAGRPQMRRQRRP